MSLLKSRILGLTQLALFSRFNAGTRLNIPRSRTTILVPEYSVLG